MLKMFMVSLVLAGFSAFPAPWDARADIGPAAENVLVASVPQTESSDEEKATFDGEAAEIKENEEKPAPSKTEAGSASDERGNAAYSRQRRGILGFIVDWCSASTIILFSTR